MGYFGRVFEMLTGRGKQRIPRELELLGAPSELVAEARTKSDVEQEEMLMQFVEGKHAAILDWRAKRDEIYAELEEVLTDEEWRLLPKPEDVPESATAAITR